MPLSDMGNHEKRCDLEESISKRDERVNHHMFELVSENMRKKNDESIIGKQQQQQQ
jgi:hypothetical protein